MNIIQRILRYLRGLIRPATEEKLGLGDHMLVVLKREEPK
jgi:hypothetical protein